MTTELEVRAAALEYREEADAETGYLEGIAVPWDQTVTIRNADGTSYSERFERGSVELDGTVWLYDSHRTPIGVVEAAETRDDGLFIRARFALSDLAKSVRELVKNGARNALSVGFSGIESRDDAGVLVRTLTRLREVSVVEKPAYSLATVLSIREENTDREPVTETKEEAVDNTASAAEVTELRGAIEELDQRITMLPSAPVAEKTEHRSAAEMVQALNRGDADAVERYNLIQERAYAGGTTADAPIKDAWIGDLTDIFDASSGVLSNLFGSAVLPQTGMNLEYAELLDNTIKFEAVAEGADLPMGNVKVTTKTVPVNLYGGATRLTRMQIERSTLPVLGNHLEALAQAAGARKKAVLRASFNTVVADRVAVAGGAGVQSLGGTLAASDAGKWEDLLIDTAIRYDAVNSAPEALVVSASVFKKLRSLTVSGERVFTVGERNSVGSLNLPGLTGSFAGLPVYLDPQATGDSAVFINKRAITQYDSAVVSLQDENVLNLSKEFSAYRYGAVAPVRPHLIVPVKFGA